MHVLATHHLTSDASLDDLLGCASCADLTAVHFAHGLLSADGCMCGGFNHHDSITELEPGLCLGTVK